MVEQTVTDEDTSKLDPFTPSDPSSTGVYYTPLSHRYTNAVRYLTEDNEITCVLAANAKFLYVLPCFELLEVELHHLRVKGFGKIGNEEDTYNMFARNDLSLCCSYPAAMVIKDLVIIKEEDFKKGVTTSGFHLPSQGVIVVWEWEWVDEDNDDNVTHISETEFSQDSIENESSGMEVASETSMDLEEIPIYTETFKCIGCQHNSDAQQTLRHISEKIRNGDVVPVDIFHEPNNPYDSRAIAFKCWIGDEWRKIGYVVKEVLDAVHNAKDNGEITNISFKWAKYLVTWTKSGPGFYAGINICKRGQWPRVVAAYASTR